MVLLSVPLLALGQSIAYYGVRATILQDWLSGSSMSTLEAYQWYGFSSTWGPILGLFLALVIGGLLGGWPLVVTGSALATLALGAQLLSDGSGDAAGLPLLVVTAGRTMATLGLLACLADSLRGRREWLALAGLGALMALVALGASTAPLATDAWLSSPLLTPHDLAWPIYLASACIMAVNTALAVGIGGVAWWLTRGRPETDPRRRRVDAGPSIAAIPMVLAGGLALGISYAGIDLLWRRAGDSGLSTILQGAMPWTFAAGAAVCVCIAVVSLIPFGLRVPTRSGPVWLAVLGALGLVLGGILALVVPFTGPGLILQATIPALAQELFGPILLFAAVRGLHWRLVVVAVVVWRGVVHVSSMAVTMLYEVPDWVPAVELAGLVCVIGCALALAITGLAGLRVWDVPAEGEARA